MNARHSHCTSRFLLFAAMMCIAVTLEAQPYERALKYNLWTDSTNPAGLRQDTVSVSFAELYGRMTGGDFKHTYEASSAWSAGARAASVKNLDRFSLKGGFSFDQTSGQDMCGSMMVRPGYYPLDVLEFTPGRKTLQTYAFDGSISVDLSSRWRLGGGIDFQSANYSKRKDLRHTNYRLDMTVSPGLQFHEGNVSFGINYIYSKDSETVDAEQIGTGESSYMAFLDKGLMYGKNEVWTGSGVHLDEDGVKGFPLKQHFHGAAAQIQLWDTYYEMKYLHGEGLAGEKQSIWYRFPSDIIDLRVAERWTGGGMVVYYRAGYAWNMQRSRETVLDKITENGVTITQEYGSNQILARMVKSSFLEAEFIGTGGELLLRWDSARSRSTASQMYPFLMKQKLTEWNLTVSPVLHRKGWDVSLPLVLSGGNVSETEPGEGVEGVISRPFRLQEYYDIEMDYRTSTRLSADLTVRRNLPRGLYVEADAGLLTGFGLQYIDGAARWDAALSVGLNF